MDSRSVNSDLYVILLRKDDIGSIMEPTSSLVWADIILADFQRVISCYLQDISTYLTCTAQRVLGNYIYVKIQTELGMFTKQNQQGLNQLIWRLLWLMTSAAADVISVPGVCSVKLKN